LSSAESHFGLKYEWWTMNNGPLYTNSHSPLATPSEPVMLGSLFGRSLTDLYGTSDPQRLPFVQRLRYDRASPKTYEVVFINWEGQQHPWHTHGHNLDIVGHGWLNPETGWRGSFNASSFDLAVAFGGLAPFDEAVPVVARVDTFTSAAHSYVVFRITADNPGAWMMHCHMDYHLEAGMGMLWSVEQEGGGYDLPPPPDDFRVCAREATFAAARALHLEVAEATLAAAQLAAGNDLDIRLQEAEEEILALRRDKTLYFSVLVGLLTLFIAAASARLVVAARNSVSSGARIRGSVAEAGFPRVLGSPTGSYVSVSD